jgi:hypothetical protein
MKDTDSIHNKGARLITANRISKPLMITMGSRPLFMLTPQQQPTL